MTAVRLHSFGGPECLAVEPVEMPTADVHEVVLRVRAAGVNHLDLDIRAGTSRLPVALPHVLGMEAAGEVATLGSEVEGVAPGDRAAVLYQTHCGTCAHCKAGEHSLCAAGTLLGVHRPGAYAEYLKVAADRLVPLPSHVSFEDAAALQLSFGTAWHALVTRAQLRQGETVLVSAAGSGVGSAALQVSAFLGARAIASVGSPSKAQRAREMGAALVVDYSHEPLAETVVAATGGVDVVLEHVGGSLFAESLECLRPNGRMVVLGGHAGEVVPLDLIALFRNQWQVIGSRRATDDELRRVFELLAGGVFRPAIHTVMPLTRAVDAHRLLSARESFGKVVLRP